MEIETYKNIADFFHILGLIFGLAFTVFGMVLLILVGMLDKIKDNDKYNKFEKLIKKYCILMGVSLLFACLSLIYRDTLNIKYNMWSINPANEVSI